jgi:competence protein ComEA
MLKRVKTVWIVSCSFCLFVLLVGFGLILTVTTTHAQAPKSLVDLNTASEKELESLKGVGPATAKKIIAGRPYSSVGDLSKAGVPEKTIEGLKPFVTVGKPAAASPVPAEKKTATPPAPSKAAAAPSAAPKAVAPEVQSKPAASSAPSAAPSPSAVAPQKAPAKASSPAPAKLAPGQKVNINTATKDQLDALPEIGPVKAQAIIDGRPYKKTEDIMKVKGIKEGTFSKIKDFITVE